MKLTIEINLDNAAFEDDPDELSRILRRFEKEHIDTLWDFRDSGRLFDINGNAVGHWEITD